MRMPEVGSSHWSREIYRGGGNRSLAPGGARKNLRGQREMERRRVDTVALQGSEEPHEQEICGLISAWLVAASGAELCFDGVAHDLFVFARPEKMRRSPCHFHVSPMVLKVFSELVGMDYSLYSSKTLS